MKSKSNILKISSIYLFIGVLLFSPISAHAQIAAVIEKGKAVEAAATGKSQSQSSAQPSSATASAPTPAAAPAPAPAPVAPKEDVYGRSTPKALVDNFLQSMKTENYEKAAMYLDLSAYSKEAQQEKGISLSKALLEVLDQSGIVAANSKLSNDPNGDVNDGLALDLEIIGSMKINEQKVDVLAQRVNDPTYGQIWKISAETVKKIPSAFAKLSTGYIDSILPEILINTKVYGVPVGHWMAIFAIAAGSLLLSIFFSFAIILFIRVCWKSTSSGFGKYLLDAFIWPIRFYIAVGIFAITTNFAGISIIARQNFSTIASFIAWFSLAWIFWSIIDLLTEAIKSKLLREKKKSALSAVVFFRRTARSLLIIVVMIVASNNMGVDVTAGLTALGIGGLALAFAAQKTLENFVASLNVIIEQPLRIGDYCKIGDMKGTVLDIGMRSTRIQTVDKTVITIPNSQIASVAIENYSLRDRFLFQHDIGLRYETTPDQLRYIVVKIRELLYSHPCIDPEVVRARFSKFNSSDLNVNIFTYIYAEGYEEFMEVQEDLLLHIMKIVEEAGSGFAFPSQTIYLGRDKQIHKEKQTDAEKEVHKWRDESILKIYRFTPEQVTEMANSIDYPPLSSTTHVNYF